MRAGAGDVHACPLMSVGWEEPRGCLGPDCMWWVTRRTRAAEFSSCAVALVPAPAPVDGTSTIVRDLGERR